MAKFVKGFFVSLGLFLGLSIIYAIIVDALSGGNIGAAFSDIGAFSQMLYGSASQPSISILVQYLGISATINPAGLTMDTTLIMSLLGFILPVALAGILGSVAERKSLTLTHIFFSVFLGIMVVSTLGIILQVIVWPDNGLDITILGLIPVKIEYWQWFLPSALTLSAFNAFFWCAIGLLITSKTWA